MINDTIAAISTPLGEGGLAVVRLSGPEVFTIADKIFTPLGQNAHMPSSAPSHTIHYGRIVRENKPVDEVMVAILRAPNTYTRENMVEITCHGGMLVTRMVLETVLASGARLALPGEFTKRAFINGRIDLAQAEAVADLIHAQTELSLAAAQEQLAGKLSSRINRLRDDLVNIMAHIEAHIDFPEEDIAPDTRNGLVQRLENGLDVMENLLRTAREGQVLRRGIRTAIVGRPNSGKSSLLNQLLGRDRAIVSPIPGTTRDTIEETANIRGFPVVFVDTAGLRYSKDPVELEGIRRSHESAAKAELILHVVDQTEVFPQDEVNFLNTLAGKKRVLVINKMDLPCSLTLPQGLETVAVKVSCITGEGIEALKDQMRGLMWSGELRGDMLEAMINARHQNCLERASEAMRRTLQCLGDNVTLELVAMELRIAVNAVGEIVGKTATDDILDAIFSQFCIGK